MKKDGKSAHSPKKHILEFSLELAKENDKRMSLGQMQAPWRILELQSCPRKQNQSLNKRIAYLTDRKIWHHLVSSISEWLGTNEQMIAM